MLEPKQKLLIIEDDPIISSVYNKRFSNLGYEVAIYGRGDGAIEKIDKFQPQAILLDLLLPGKDGQEVLQELKNNSKLKDIPVVVLSNVADKTRRQAVLAAGAAGYLVKAETDLDEVVKAVQEILRK